MAETWLLTGASGYLGSRLLRLAAGRPCARWIALAHRTAPDAASARGAPDLEIVRGDLLCPQTYRDRLQGCDGVVHLAAATGKRRPRDYFRMNVEGTRRLVETCQALGVRRFLYVSTIAARYRDQTRYYYAQSKRCAEEIVTASGLDYTIVRPTIVIGPGAPVLEGLARLAGLPVMPMFGAGRALVQPVFVDDVAECLLSIVLQRRFRGEMIEVGGPDVLSIEQFLNRVRQVRFGKTPRTLHLPLRPLRSILGVLERFTLPLLPMTAGQLALFANDGTTARGPLEEIYAGAFRDPSAVLAMEASYE